MPFYERYYAELIYILNDSLPAAIARIWVRLHLRKRYPDAKERKYVAQRDFVTLHSEFKMKVASVLPWIWAALFAAAISLLIAVTFMGE